MWYCLFAHNNSPILEMFYIKLSWNFFSHKCWICGILNIFCHKFFEGVKEIHKRQFLSTKASADTSFLLPQTSKQWNTENYWGSEDRGEVDIDSDVNHLASGNLRKSTTVPSQSEKFPWTWTCCFMFFYCWYHLKNLPGIV